MATADIDVQAGLAVAIVEAIINEVEKTAHTDEPNAEWVAQRVGWAVQVYCATKIANQIHAGRDSLATAVARAARMIR